VHGIVILLYNRWCVRSRAIIHNRAVPTMHLLYDPPLIYKSLFVVHREFSAFAILWLRSAVSKQVRCAQGFSRIES